MTLRDILRIAHPKADAPERAALFGWLTGKTDDEQARAAVPAIDAFLTAQAVTTEAAAIRVVTERGVPWEYLPSQALTSPGVWEALASTVGMRLRCCGTWPA
jgi:60 kDa SS-A/Ro ribonucleoprotein